MMSFMLLRMGFVVTYLLLLPIHTWSFGPRHSHGRRTESTYNVRNHRIRPATTTDLENITPSLLISSNNPVPNNGSSSQLGLTIEQLKPFLKIAVHHHQIFITLVPFLSL